MVMICKAMAHSRLPLGADVVPRQQDGCVGGDVEPRQCPVILAGEAGPSQAQHEQQSDLHHWDPPHILQYLIFSLTGFLSVE